MPTIGVRELRQQTAEVLRQVREEKAEYLITHQGKPIALLTPVDEEAIEKAVWESRKQAMQDSWNRYEELAEVIRQGWPAEKETQTLLDEIRS